MGKEYKTDDTTLEELMVEEPSTSYTYADYLKWTFEERVELIKGKIFKMTPAPSRMHQKVGGKVFYYVMDFLKESPCEAYVAPFDVRLPKNREDSYDKVYTVVQPDICVICNPEILDDKGCNGAPDLIFEILSPSTAKKDLTIKHQLYQENKVKEYWIVYPNEEIVEVYLLENEVYSDLTRYVNTDEVSVKTLPGLTIALKKIFQH